MGSMQTVIYSNVSYLDLKAFKERLGEAFKREVSEEAREGKVMEASSADISQGNTLYCKI